MIPKIIHYCWFGGNPLPIDVIKNIESWKNNCPDYSFVEWNETNFDIDMFQYAKEAYDAKKWAFVTDVVRLYVLAEYGGIYMDTDVKVIRNLNPLLEFEAVSGFQSDTQVPTGLIASEKGNNSIISLLDSYNDRHFFRDDGTFDLTTNVDSITEYFESNGLILDNTIQTVNGFTFLPSDYLCAYDLSKGKERITKNTFCIHQFSASWAGGKARMNRRIYQYVCCFLGKKNADSLLKCYKKAFNK